MLTFKKFVESICEYIVFAKIVVVLRLYDDIELATSKYVERFDVVIFCDEIELSER